MALKRDYKLSQLGTTLIRFWEGCELTAYKDTGSIWTIGIGTIQYPDGTPVKEGDKITLEQAEEYLKHDCIGIEKCLNNFCNRYKIDLKQNQVDALISLMYNVGADILDLGRSMHHALRSGDSIKILDAFHKYNKARGRIVIGLVKRRKSEAHMFMTGKFEVRFKEEL